MSNKSDTVYFLVPEALSFGWSFKMTVEHIVDRMPQFASVSGARKGGKLIEAVEKALDDEAHVVAWPRDLWEIVKVYVESDAFQLPVNQIFRNNVGTDQIVPKRLYLPHIDALLGAEGSPPAPKKSVAEPLPQIEQEASPAPELAAPAA